MRKTIIAALALAGLAAQAGADSVDLAYVGRGLGWGNKITLDGVSTNHVFTGGQLHEFSNGTGLLSVLNGLTLATFNTDVRLGVTRNGATYEAMNLAQLPGSGAGLGETRARAIENLLAYAQSGETSFSDVVDARNFAAAMQFMIWEITYEFDPKNRDDGIGEIDITSGRFSATQTRDDRPLSRGIMRHFNTLRDRGVRFGDSTRILGFGNPNYQDQIVVMVPLPSAAGMGFASLALIAIRRRR